MTKPASQALRLADIKESLTIANEPLRDGRYPGNAKADIRYLLDQVAALTASRARLREAMTLIASTDRTDGVPDVAWFVAWRNGAKETAKDALTADDEALRALIGEG